MAVIVTRAGKGAPLSNAECDDNFTNLNTDKLEINAALGTPASVTLTNATGLPTAGLVDNAVTDAKLRDSAGLSVIGRGANSTGDPADIVAGTNHQVLRRDGSSLGFGAVDLSSNQAVTGTLPVNQGGTGLTSYTANGVVYASGTGTLASGSALTFDGTGIRVIGSTNDPFSRFNELNSTFGVASVSQNVALNINAGGSAGRGAQIEMGTAGVRYFNLSANAAAATLGTTTALPLLFLINDAEAMRLTSTGLEVKGKLAVGYSDFSGIPTNGAAFAGSVGIGTSAPDYRVHARQDGNLNATVGITNATAGTGSLARFIAISDAGNALFGMTSSSYTDITGAQDALLINATNASGGMAFTLDGVLKMKLDSSGNLYVGTTSAPNSGEVRQLLARAGATYLQFQNTTTATGCTIGTSDQNFIVYTNTNSIGGGGGTYTERARIDSSGNLLVGTTTARTTLTVAGSISLGATPAGGVAGTAYEVVGNSAASGNANGGDLTVVAGGGSGSGTNGNLTLRAGQTISTGSVTTGGNLILESGKPSDSLAGGYIAFNGYSGNPSIATERARITSDGYLRMASGSGGIQFNGDTAAANALDDYEEGSFTFTLTGTTGAPSAPQTTTGYYTKIGRFVTVSAYFDDMNLTGATGNLIATGLPFASNSNSTNRGAHTVALFGFSFSGSLYVDLTTNSTQVSFQESRNNTSWTGIAVSAASNKYVQVTLNYMTS